MSQANHASSTTMPPAPTRRVFLCQSALAAAGAVTAVGGAQALPSAPSASEPSALFEEYLRRKAEFFAIFALPGARSEPPEWKALEASVNRAYAAAVGAIAARPVHCWRDLAELAVVSREYCWAEGGAYMGGGEALHRALVDGVLSLTEGGAHA